MTDHPPVLKVLYAWAMAAAGSLTAVEWFQIAAFASATAYSLRQLWLSFRKKK